MLTYTISRHPVAERHAHADQELRRTLPQLQVRHAQQAGAAKKKVPVTIEADEASAVSATNTQTLRRNVVIQSRGTVLRTQLAQYNETTGVATSPGQLQISDERNTLHGNSGVAYYARRQAIITGSVKIVVRPKESNTAPKGSARSEFRDPVTVFCDRVEYNWRTKVAVCTGHLTLKQSTRKGETRTATADTLTYEATPERVTLTGNVHAVDSQGRDLRGPKAIAIVRENAETFTMVGRTRIITPVDEDEEEETPAAPAAEATPSPSAPETVP